MLLMVVEILTWFENVDILYITTDPIIPFQKKQKKN